MLTWRPHCVQLISNQDEITSCTANTQAQRGLLSKYTRAVNKNSSAEFSPGHTRQLLGPYTKRLAFACYSPETKVSERVTTLLRIVVI